MTVRDNPDRRRFEALVDEEVAGYLFYREQDGELVLIHTEVDERFEDQGIGTQLAAGVMEFLRSEDAKIIPSCSFIRHYMDKNEDTQELRAEPRTEEDEESDDVEDTGSADTDSPDAGPADAKAAGSGGAAEEEDSRS